MHSSVIVSIYTIDYVYIQTLMHSSVIVSIYTIDYRL